MEEPVDNVSNPIFTLPSEILKEILDYAQSEATLFSSLVCKKFHSLVKCPFRASESSVVVYYAKYGSIAAIQQVRSLMG